MRSGTISRFQDLPIALQGGILSVIRTSLFVFSKGRHTIYTRNNMGQKCEGNFGLWVLNEILKKTYPENLEKNRGCRLGVTC